MKAIDISIARRSEYLRYSLLQAGELGHALLNFTSIFSATLLNDIEFPVNQSFEAGGVAGFMDSVNSLAQYLEICLKDSGVSCLLYNECAKKGDHILKNHQRYIINNTDIYELIKPSSKRVDIERAIIDATTGNRMVFAITASILMRQVEASMSVSSALFHDVAINATHIGFQVFDGETFVLCKTIGRKVGRKGVRAKRG